MGFMADPCKLIRSSTHACPVGAARPNWSKDVNIWAMPGDLKQSCVDNLAEDLDSTIGRFHAQA